jgi:hypothetical protein
MKNRMPELRIPLLVTLLVLPAEVIAANVALGVKVGPVASNFSFEPLDSGLGSRIGLEAGASLRVDITEQFSVLVEPGYSQRGYKELFIVVGGPSRFFDPVVSRGVRLDYVSVPVLCSLGTGHGDLRMYTIAGPRAEFRVSSKVQGEGAGIADFPSSIGDDLDKFAAAGVVGFGLQVGRTTRHSTVLETRYSFDLTNSHPGPNPSEARGRWWALLLGYYF